MCKVISLGVVTIAAAGAAYAAGAATSRGDGTGTDTAHRCIRSNGAAKVPTSNGRARSSRRWKRRSLLAKTEV